MFENTERKALLEDDFEQWLENGRNSRLGYHFMLIIWNEREREYHPKYLSTREEFNSYSLAIHESIVSVYDLYSESRITLRDSN